MASYTQTAPSPPAPFFQLPWEGNLFQPVILHCETGSGGRTDRGFRHAPHKHDVFHIVLYTRGHGAMFAGTQEHTFRRGTLALVSPGVPHEFKCRKPGEWEYDEVTFTLESAAGEVSGMDFSELLTAFTGMKGLRVPLLLHLAEDQTRAMESTFDRLLDFLLARGRLSIFYGTLTLAELFTEILRECRMEPVTTASPLEQVRKTIEVRYAEKLSVEALARQAHLSRAHFLRAFKKTFGISPIAYQHRLRVRAARVLLKTTALSCQQIADRTGYYDAYHFSKMYRKIMGHPPSHERKDAG